MRFSRALASLALVSSTAVLAAPEPMPAPAPNPQVPDIGATLGALGNLLQGQTLDNIVSLVDNGAALLTPTFVNQTQTLISIISGLIPELAPLIGGLIGGAAAPAATATAAA